MTTPRKTDNDSYDTSKNVTCPQCGREFYIPAMSMWAWKIALRPPQTEYKMLYFCSYNCRQAKRKSLAAEQAERDRARVEERKRKAHEAYMQKKEAEEK
jgi:hypothetical protein